MVGEAWADERLCFYLLAYHSTVGGAYRLMRGCVSIC